MNPDDSDNSGNFQGGQLSVPHSDAPNPVAPDSLETSAPEPTLVPEPTPVPESAPVPNLPRNPYASGNSSHRPDATPNMMASAHPSQPIVSQSSTPQPIPAQPISSGFVGGDILLQPDTPQPKKSKKPLFVIIIAAIIILGIVVFLALFQGNNSGIMLGSESTTSVKGKFNLYANHILFNTDSTDNIPDYNPDKIYAISSMLSDSENDNTNREDFFEKTSLLFNDFYELYQSDRGEIDSVVSDYQKTVTFVNNYYLLPNINDEKIIALSRMNEEKAKNEINDIFADFSFEDFEASKNFAEYNTENLTSSVLMYKIYGEVGCIDNEVVNQACLDNAIFSDEQLNQIVALADKNDELEQKISDIETEMFNNIVEQCWSVKNAL